MRPHVLLYTRTFALFAFLFLPFRFHHFNLFLSLSVLTTESKFLFYFLFFSFDSPLFDHPPSMCVFSLNTSLSDRPFRIVSQSFLNLPEPPLHFDSSHERTNADLVCSRNLFLFFPCSYTFFLSLSLSDSLSHTLSLCYSQTPPHTCQTRAVSMCSFVW